MPLAVGRWHMHRKASDPSQVTCAEQQGTHVRFVIGLIFIFLFTSVDIRYVGELRLEVLC